MTEPDILDAFSPATAAWFRAAFAVPTPAQDGAWRAISSGRHTLVVAPTGSGKTLSAFLWGLDRIGVEQREREAGGESEPMGTRVLYISPMKALAVDVERNLRSPLVGIAHAANRLGVRPPSVTVGIRSGDTSAADRRSLVSKPPHVLITTPESLYLMLTSAARETLREVDVVIIDEVHAVAGSKRGAHLAVSLERLDALVGRPVQRVGLSATVRPVEEVGRFLAGGLPVEIVQPPSTKEWDLRVVVPVPDLGDLSTAGPREGIGGPSGFSRSAGALSAYDEWFERQGLNDAPESEAGGGSDADSPEAAADSGIDIGAADLHSPAPSADSRRSATPTAPDPAATASIWPHVEERIVDLVESHTSTLIFANSRRLAERLTARLNEIHEERWAEAEGATGEMDDGAPGDRADDVSARRMPAEMMAQAGVARGATTPMGVLARAHHGSVSKEQRAEIEDDLKAGRIAAVVATSSLELGIDMGAVDLVVQVESPPSVASGLQRVGRAGHQVGAVSSGVVFPKYRGDLLQTVVVVDGMRAGRIEHLHIPRSPLDVLAQQIVAMCAMDDWGVEELLTMLRRCAPFTGLSRAVLESVLDMLAGRYPSDEFAQLRPRLVWDRVTDQLTGRPGAGHIAVTSGGTIPDRGLYGVFLAGGKGPGRRVGELDEEMVYESRVGDVFMLGTSSWRIEDITHDQVLVTPAPGQPGKLPFWRGDTLGRPAELGEQLGITLRRLAGTSPETARAELAASGLDEWAQDNLLAYLDEQREATGKIPDDRTIVIERFRDELGDWRVVVHSPFGTGVHAPWALCVAARLRERFGIDAQAVHADDGIVLRLPDVDLDDNALLAEIGELLLLDPAEVEPLVTAEIGGSALFASRFRECAARALLLPRRRPDRRQALWQQRQRAAQLLSVAAQFPAFPIILETVRECLQDVYDVPAFRELMRKVAGREVNVHVVDTSTPSPFAKSLLFGYVAQFLYDGDSPLAERRAAALSLDPGLLAELLGSDAATGLGDLLDPDIVARTEAELQRLAPERRARSLEEVADLIRVLGPLSTAEIVARTTTTPGARPAMDTQPAVPAREPAVQELAMQSGTSRDASSEGATPAAGSPIDEHDVERADAPHADPRLVESWLTQLRDTRRVLQVRIGGIERWAAVEDASRLRDALGVPLPPGVPFAFTEPVPDPLGDLVARYARHHGPFTAADVGHWLGIGPAVAVDVLRRLVTDGRVTSGRLRPGEHSREDTDYCGADILRLLRRRSLASLRKEVEPVTPVDYSRFLLGWHGIGGDLRGVDGTLRVVEQLSGVPVPASSLETLVLPTRLPGYDPRWLDELTASGEVIWQGHGTIPGDDGWVSLHLGDAPEISLAPPTLPADDLSSDARDLLGVFDSGGAYFIRQLESVLGRAGPQLLDSLWELVWSGYVGNDTLTPLRTLTARKGAHRQATKAPRGRRYAGRRMGLGGLGVPGGMGTPGRYAGLGATARLGTSPGAASPDEPGEPSRTSAVARRGPGSSPLGAASSAGRWFRLPAAVTDPTVRAVSTAELLLDRHGIVTRGAVAAEEIPGGFAGVYRVLATAEEAGRVRRGYFIEGLGAAQFGTGGAVDRLRAEQRRDDQRRDAPEWRPPTGSRSRSGTAGADGEPLPPAVVLAATDPANPYGSALDWPSRPGGEVGGRSGAEGRAEGHRPGRRAGALVVLVDGELAVYLERGGRTLLCWAEAPPDMAAAAQALAGAVRAGAIGPLSVERADGDRVLTTPHPFARALAEAGFHVTPRGLRMRR